MQTIHDKRAAFPCSALSTQQLESNSKRRRFITKLAAVALFTLLIPVGRLCAQDAAPVDQATVQAKIHDLGIRDDTLPNDDRPRVWLWHRRELIVQQLIAGLGDPDVRVADNCLQILNECQSTNAIVDALLPIAGNTNNQINAAATLALVRYGSDERARKLMVGAFVDEKRFPNPLDRAALAAAGGRKADAIAILNTVVASPPSGSDDAVRAVAQLAQIGPEAVPALVTISQGRKWAPAVTAYQSLAKLDPQNHSLTTDQREFLDKMRQGGKVAPDFYHKRAQELAALDRRQIGPFVMQALLSTDYEAPLTALYILTSWKDKEALPEIKALIENPNPYLGFCDAMAAYLAIDGGATSEKLLLRRAAAQTDSPDNQLLWAVLKASIPEKRRLTLLLKLRGTMKEWPCALAEALNFCQVDLAAILPALMDQETDIRALGMYADTAGKDKQNRFGPQIVRAMHLLAGASMKTSADDADFVSAAKKILNAVARQKVKGVEKDITALAAAKSRILRVAALSTAVNISGALDQNATALLDELANPELRIRIQAAQGLAGLVLTDNDQRRQVEAVLLKHLGKPTEDAAMRLLANFGGTDSVRLLQSIMDESDVHRAVYAAWVLAQIADQPVREAALRRLAIHGLFRQWCSQIDSGIGFQVAADLGFGQSTQLGLNHDKDDNQKIHIPRNLLQPPNLTSSEQSFAIASYHEACGAIGGACPYFYGMDTSYIPLLQVIANEDLRLDALFVKNQRVAYFPNRHDAAGLIARFTSQPAIYIGLGGEKLSSEQKPLLPYPDQEMLIARFALDRILKDLPDSCPETQAQWDEIGWRDSLLRRLVEVEQFGEPLQKAIIAEIRQRGLTERFLKVRLAERWLKE